MGRVKIIMDDIQMGPDPLPEDQVYTIEFRSADEKIGKKGPYLNCMLRVTDHALYENYTIFENLPLPNPKVIETALALPNSMADKKKEMIHNEQKKCFRTKQAFLATGAPYDDTGFDTNDLLGRKGLVRVKTEEYEGRLRSKVDRYLPKK